MYAIMFGLHQKPGYIMAFGTNYWNRAGNDYNFIASIIL